MAHFVSQTALDASSAISSAVKAFLISALLLLAAPQAAMAFGAKLSTDWRGGIPDSNVLAYEITRKGKRLGFQTIEFEQLDNGDVVANIHVELVLKLGPIPLFRYQHENRELWRDGRLIELISKTNNNGGDVFTRLNLQDGELTGSGTKYKGDLQGVTHSTSYFDPNFVRQPLLVSSQDGRLLKTETQEIGRETLNLKIGQVEATRFRTTGKLKLDIWYTDAGRWVQTKFSRGGYTLYISAVNPTELPPRKEWKRP